MKFGVVVFPGSNCDHDTVFSLKDVLGQDAFFLWHKDHDLRGADCVVLPGGFAYGDYLRSGAIARFSPLMREVGEFAGRGGMVLGICNGFQVLLEMNLLEGAMIRNKRLKFLCQYVHIRVENEQTVFTSKARKSQVLRIPIAHFDGNYFAPAETLEELEREGRSFSVTPTRAATSPRRPTSTARCTTSPASSTGAVTSWVSCPIPSGLRSCCSAARTAALFSNP